jgi:hypothetical protein
MDAAWSVKAGAVKGGLFPRPSGEIFGRSRRKTPMKRLIQFKTTIPPLRNLLLPACFAICQKRRRSTGRRTAIPAATPLKEPTPSSASPAGSGTHPLVSRRSIATPSATTIRQRVFGASGSSHLRALQFCRRARCICRRTFLQSRWRAFCIPRNRPDRKCGFQQSRKRTLVRSKWSVVGGRRLAAVLVAIFCGQFWDFFPAP